MKVKDGSKKRAKKIKFEEFSGQFSKLLSSRHQVDKDSTGVFKDSTGVFFEVNYAPPSSDNGVKFDQEKVKMQLLDPTFLEEVAKVFTLGAAKYGENNYKKGLHVSRCLGAVDRHLKAFKVLEDNDPETGLSHLAHAACCLQMIYYNYKNKQEFDDRQSTFK